MEKKKKKSGSGLSGEHFLAASLNVLCLLVFSCGVQRALSPLQVPGAVLCQQLSQEEMPRELFKAAGAIG